MSRLQETPSGDANMSKVALALVVLTLGSTSALAQTSWAEKLLEPPLVHDFGSVPRGAQLYHRYKISNPYAVPLEISTRVGCSCVSVTASSRVLEPKKDGYLDVFMDTRRFQGAKTVNIFFNVEHNPDEANPNHFASAATLQVSANSRTDVVLNPGQITFGVVSAGQSTPPMVLDVEYAGILDWRITEVVKHSAPLEVSFSELYRRTGQQVGYRVSVALKPDAPAGPLKHELFLRTNDPASPLVPILVEATIQASLTAVPSKVSTGHLKVGESVTKLVMVKGSKQFRVTSVEGLGEGVAAELPRAASEVQVIKLKCQPTKPGELRRDLLIKTDLNQTAPLSVSIDGVVDP
jgi:hypothetical protein